MKGTDIVDLVYIVNPNNYMRVTVTRQVASDSIRKWWDAREAWNKLGWFRRLWCRVRHWNLTWSFAVNMKDEDDPNRTYAQWAVKSDLIMGMYVVEHSADHERMMKAQLENYLVSTEHLKECTKSMREHMRGHDEGEEWKGEGDGD